MLLVLREELCEEFLREGNNRIVLHDLNEWRILNCSNWGTKCNCHGGPCRQRA